MPGWLQHSMAAAVRLWDPATGRAVRGIQADTTGTHVGVTGVAYSPDGKLLASADADGTVPLLGVSLFIPEGAGRCQAGFRPAVSRPPGLCRA
jgi:WD40 repeat protein